MAEVEIVGGCYHESVAEPPQRSLCGSGMRAAAILRSLGNSVRLHTTLDAASVAEASGIAASYDVSLSIGTSERQAAIDFRYSTPLSTPSQSVVPNRSAGPSIEASLVLAFGMVEGPWRIRADRAVVDPQHGSPDQIGLGGSVTGELVLILNAREAARLSGTLDLDRGGEELLRITGADAVIVKQGILGATVVSEGGLHEIEVFPTSRVHPIGSGDAFSAGFADAWLGGGADVVEAARHASAVAASFCQTGLAQIDFQQVGSLGESIPRKAVRIYLAGPFFSAAERWLIAEARKGLLGLGVAVFSPLHDVGLGGDEVAELDITGLCECQGVLALLDGGDPGTLFEVGWARKAGIPVCAFSETPASAAWTMLRGTGCEVVDDLSTAVYRSAWLAMQGGQ